MSGTARRSGDHRIRLLVVSQRMDLTGAPRQLANLLPGLARSGRFRLTLLRGSDGPLTGSMASQVDRVCREPRTLRAIARLGRRSPPPVARILHRGWSWAMRSATGRFDLVYVNSLISARLAEPFADAPTVVHVHELGALAESFGGPARALVRHAAAVVVPSGPARAWVARGGVPTERIVVLPGALPPAAFLPPPEDDVAALREQLRLQADDRVIATVGWVGHAKGSDRFLEVARRVTAQAEGPVRFLWIGGGSGTGEEQRFRAAVVEAGLDHVVSVEGGLDDLRPLYALADAVLVTSREESLSLVALESAAQGTPVVCFPGAGGPDELADEGVVTIPSSGDADRVAEAICDLLADRDRRERVGSAAREVAAVRHGAAPSQDQLVELLVSLAPAAVSSMPG
jgi:glycosyltransferase involved in cell wall biosynthesis